MSVFGSIRLVLLIMVCVFLFVVVPVPVVRGVLFLVLLCLGAYAFLRLRG
jgi:hypothetical protein